MFFLEQDVGEKIKQTEHLLHILWTAFLIILYSCSFLTEYHFSGESEKMVPGEIILVDLQKLCFFALMGLGFLIDIVRMRQDKNKAFIFLLLTLFLGGAAGGIGAMQYQFFFHMSTKVFWSWWNWQSTKKMKKPPFTSLQSIWKVSSSSVKD